MTGTTKMDSNGINIPTAKHVIIKAGGGRQGIKGSLKNTELNGAPQISGSESQASEFCKAG